MKAFQQIRPRPAVLRHIVPAIPLPYIQKREQQQAARARARDAAIAPAILPHEVPSSPSPSPTPMPASPATKSAPLVVNDTRRGLVSHFVEGDGASASPTEPLISAAQQLTVQEPLDVSQKETNGKRTTLTFIDFTDCRFRRGNPNLSPVLRISLHVLHASRFRSRKCPSV